MGYSKDLGTGIVKDICPRSGYPRTPDGHLLNTISMVTGEPMPNWDKRGTELPNFTNPYGHLFFAAGSGDSFTCFDYARIDAGPRGLFIILDATLNSETGGFIMTAGYELLRCNTEAERIIAVRTAYGMVDHAGEWMNENNVRHTRKGWNQTPAYFARAVFCNLFNETTFSERELRFGSRKLDKLIAATITKEKA